MLLRSEATAVTGDLRPLSRAALRILHGCRSHVAGAAWLRQPCSMVRCWRGERDGSPFPVRATPVASNAGAVARYQEPLQPAEAGAHHTHRRALIMPPSRT